MTGSADHMHPVLVVVDAVADQVPLLRSVAADVAVRNDFDLDAVEDLRMAVDEAAALLVGVAELGARLQCELTPERSRVLVRMVVHPAVHAAPLARDTMGWQILAALASEVRTSTGDDGRVSIELSRSRGVELTA